MDSTKMQIILECLADFQKMGIEVVVYIAPNARDFLDHCYREPVFEVYAAEFQAFKKKVEAAYSFFEAEYPSDIGLDDRFMLDCVHPGEVMSAMQLLRFLKSEKGKNSYLNRVDTARLEQRLRAPGTMPLSFLVEHSLVVQDLQELPAHDSAYAGMKMVRTVLDKNFELESNQ